MTTDLPKQVKTENCREEEIVKLIPDSRPQIKLNNQKCEPCVDGRTKLRPLIVEEEICEEEEVREICTETFRERSEWSKRCTMPADMKMELIEQVLSKADPTGGNLVDRITFRNKTDRSRQESKIVRMRVPAQGGRGGQDRVRSKVNFQFVSKTTTSRPTGLPYIHANTPGDHREENRNVKSYDQPAQL